MSICDSQSVSFVQPPPEMSTGWLALTVKPQHELSSALALEMRSIQSYAPFFSERRRWSDRSKVVNVALFPGYVFARFKQNQRTAALQCQGVRSVVQFGTEPAEIPDSAIQSIRLLVGSGACLEPWEGLIPGDKIRVETGPLAGATGVFLAHKGKSCLAVSLDLLGRSVIASIPQETVAPLQARSRFGALPATAHR